MKRQLSQIGRTEFIEFADLEDVGISEEPWSSFERSSLSADDESQLALLLRRYRGMHVTRINEATLWSRLVYPLLLAAERDSIKAWSEVPISAQIGEVELQGVVDGALAAGGADAPNWPLLLVIKAKRGTEAANPVHPLYAALLCVGWNQTAKVGAKERVCYGCFTIADTWTFVEARIRGVPGRPRVQVRSSREYSEKLEAHLILSVLRGIEDRWIAETAAEVERAFESGSFASAGE